MKKTKRLLILFIMILLIFAILPNYVQAVVSPSNLFGQPISTLRTYLGQEASGFDKGYCTAWGWNGFAKNVEAIYRAYYDKDAKKITLDSVNLSGASRSSTGENAKKVFAAFNISRGR